MTVIESLLLSAKLCRQVLAIEMMIPNFCMAGHLLPSLVLPMAITRYMTQHFLFCLENGGYAESTKPASI
jgi:hypothetical protein